MLLYRSRNLREASFRATEAQAQNALFFSHEAQLQNLGLALQSGHAKILERIETTRPSGSDPSSQGASIACRTRQELAPWRRTKRSPARTFRLLFLVGFRIPCGNSQHTKLDDVWNFRVRPVNLRPQGDFVFDVVRSGSVEAVQKLLTSGEMSVSDHENSFYDLLDSSLLLVSPT